MTQEEFDIVIVGAGPAGCICALQLAGKGLRIALLEKESFPRDKICGDALSLDVINQFYRIDPALVEKFKALPQKKASQGVRFYAPNQTCLDIAFTKSTLNGAEGYIAKRIDFDNFLFDQIKDLEDVTVFLNHEVEEIQNGRDEIVLRANGKSYKSKIAVGADGANSILNRKLLSTKIERDHHCAGLRQYYENVSDFHPDNHIELHFYKDLLPGYFWIFPLPDNRANVGIGMLSSAVSKRKINLREKLSDIIQNHPNVKHRFANAKPLESIKGFGLPIGSKKRQISGHRFLLLGDAASLIDPFAGEGIGNAIRSGRIAATHIVNAFEQGRFDADFNRTYDNEIYSKMGNELRIGRSLQNLSKHSGIFNFVVNKANTNESVRMLLTSMLGNADLKKELTKPSFYFKLIFT